LARIRGAFIDVGLAESVRITREASTGERIDAVVAGTTYHGKKEERMKRDPGQ
jgi:hypothetical protein